MGRFITTVFMLLLLLSSAQAADSMYVNSKKIKLYQQPNYNSAVVTQLEKGDQLEVVQQQDKWIQVKHATLSGWVPGYSLTSSKPAEESVSFFNRIKSFFMSDNKRSRVSTISTAGGIRGLSEEEGESAGQKDYEALQKMERMTVSDEEVEKFVEGSER